MSQCRDKSRVLDRAYAFLVKAPHGASFEISRILFNYNSPSAAGTSIRRSLDKRAGKGGCDFGVTISIADRKIILVKRPRNDRRRLRGVFVPAHRRKIYQQRQGKRTPRDEKLTRERFAMPLEELCAMHPPRHLLDPEALEA